MTFDRGTVVVWVEPDRLTYRTAASLKEHMLDDFGVMYRYLLRDFDLQVAGVKVEAVDPLFLEAGARYYMLEEQGGAQKIVERSLAVKLYRDDGANGLHLQKLDAKELEKIKAAKGTSDGKLVAVGTIYYRVARLPLGFAVDASARAGLSRWIRSQSSALRSARRAGACRLCEEAARSRPLTCSPGRRVTPPPDLATGRSSRATPITGASKCASVPELDDVFGITNDKQRVRPIEDFWRLLHEEEVDELLNREQSWQHQEREARTKARRKPQPSPEPTPAELSAAAVDTIVGRPTPIPDHELPKVREKFEEAVAQQSQITGKSLEEAAAVIAEEGKHRPYRTEYFEDPYAPFYRPEWGVGGQIVVWVNRKHPFYDALYTASMGKLAQEGLSLLLIALAKGELKATDPTAKLWYEEQRTKVWSSFLGTAMRDLIARMPASEKEEEVGTAVA